MGILSIFRSNKQTETRNDEKTEKELLVASLDDKDLTIAAIRQQLFGALENVSLTIPDNQYLLEHQGFLKNCSDPQQLLNYLYTIPELNRDYLKAIMAIIQHNTLYIADPANHIPATSARYTIGGSIYTDYQKYIQHCASIIYDKFNMYISVVGEFDGHEREQWHKIKTPYGVFTRGNRNKEIAPAGSKPGDILVENPGYTIGERVYNESKDQECVVLDAGHKHGYKGEGTANVVVMYDDKTVETTVPRLLKSLSSKQSNYTRLIS